MEKRHFLLLLLLITSVLYLLAGVLFNPLIIWVAGSLFFAYPIFSMGKKYKNQSLCYAAYGYILGWSGFSLFYHLAWFFDWGKTQTGSSTSALIFIWFPIYSIVIGVLFGVAGYIVGKFIRSNS